MWYIVKYLVVLVCFVGLQCVFNCCFSGLEQWYLNTDFAPAILALLVVQLMCLGFCAAYRQSKSRYEKVRPILETEDGLTFPGLISKFRTIVFSIILLPFLSYLGLFLKGVEVFHFLGVFYFSVSGVLLMFQLLSIFLILSFLVLYVQFEEKLLCLLEFKGLLRRSLDGSCDLED